MFEAYKKSTDCRGFRQMGDRHRNRDHRRTGGQTSSWNRQTGTGTDKFVKIGAEESAAIEERLCWEV